MSTNESSNTSLSDALDTWRSEITDYLVEMASFRQMDLVEVLQRLSAYSARASWIRGVVIRYSARQAEFFRTKELDPFLTEVDRQFKVWSRVAAIRQSEWEMNGRAHG
jgi:hypothetical protein